MDAIICSALATRSVLALKNLETSPPLPPQKKEVFSRAADENDCHLEEKFVEVEHIS